MRERGDDSDSVTRIVDMENALRVTEIVDPVTKILQVSIELRSGGRQAGGVAVTQASGIDHSTHAMPLAL